jgi:inosine/xanthosine triphosphatase
MKVAVGSENPVKIEAVRLAFTKIWPDKTWEFISVNANSKVSDQPMSDQESITGAQNRAYHALNEIQADYGVGLESGLQETGKQWLDCGWIVVLSKEGIEGLGATVMILVPNAIMEFIRNGTELGFACDAVFRQTNTKHGQGHFGLMTNGGLTRTAAYRDGVIAALAAFLHPELA